MTPWLDAGLCAVLSVQGQVSFDGVGWDETLTYEIGAADGCETVALHLPDGVVLESWSGKVRASDDPNYRLDAARLERTAITDDGTVVLDLQAGPYLKIEGTLEVTVNTSGSDVDQDVVELGGTFSIEQITLPDPDGTGPLVAPKVIRIGATGVHATVLGAGLEDGQGGFIFTPDGVAGKMRVTVTSGSAGGTGIGIGGDVILEINNTGKPINETISVGTTNIAINFTEGNVLKFAILNASIEIPPFFELNGDFTIQSEGDRTLYGARNVSIFLGVVTDGEEIFDDEQDSAFSRHTGG